MSFLEDLSEQKMDKGKEQHIGDGGGRGGKEVEVAGDKVATHHQQTIMRKESDISPQEAILQGLLSSLQTTHLTGSD
jgi:hypothetical protein